MERVLIALGSNINSECNMREAVVRLASRCRLVAVSPVYETAPVGNTEQPDFMNAAALIETNLTATELKAGVLQTIEQEMGRVRTEDKNAPRTIDLDIALYGAQVLDLESRHIPDPDIMRYPHLAVPLADLAPTMRHPEEGRTLREIAQSLPASGLEPCPDIVLWPVTVDKPIKERQDV
jgi:2-amino-4-hydroxy-6-hydroxymethyldihydropteridine diphosphokinase